MSYSNIEVRKVTPRIGAEIHGVDLSQPLDEATAQAIRDALTENQVIFFRDQDITLDQHKAFGRLFGDLHIHPAAPAPEGHPEVFRIHADEHSTHIAGEAWHTDVSCDAEPPMGSILRLHTVPESGGDTLFASMYAAYDGLSPTMQEFLCGLTAVHSGEHVYRGRYSNKEGETDSSRGDIPVSEHPVIRTHPVSGRRGIYVNYGFTIRIKELSQTESDALLRFLFDHVSKPDYQVRFRWRPNSIAFWDNRCTQHLALWDYYPQVRSGYRITIKGDRPFFEE